MKKHLFFPLFCFAIALGKMVGQTTVNSSPILFNPQNDVITGTFTYGDPNLTVTDGIFLLQGEPTSGSGSSNPASTAAPAPLLAQWKYSAGGNSSWANLAQDYATPAQLRFGDFNGNGTTDVFRTKDGQWYFSEGGKSNWVKLAHDATLGISDLAFGDFNGDKKMDVFATVNGQWKYSSGGTGAWQNLAKDDALLTELRFGDFNGDGKTDVFKVYGGKWFISYGGSASYVQSATDDASGYQLRFGDFNGDKKTDVFKTANGQWYYSAGGTSNWAPLATDNTPITDLRFGDFNGDGKTDVFKSDGNYWYYSAGGAGNWVQLANDNTPVRYLFMGDFNGDGKTDVFSTNHPKLPKPTFTNASAVGTAMGIGGGGYSTYTGTPALWNKLNDLAAQAAEIYFSETLDLTPAQALQYISGNQQTRDGISGILFLLVCDNIKKNGTDAGSAELKQWATEVYRPMKVAVAKGILEEFYVWKADPCSYEGLSQNACRGKYGATVSASGAKPPYDLIQKAGIENSIHGQESGIASATITGAAAIGGAASFASLISVMTFKASLFATIVGSSTAITGTAAGAAGIFGGPFAVAAASAAIGISELMSLLETESFEPTLKARLGDAMTGSINMLNVVSLDDQTQLFFLGFMKSSRNGFCPKGCGIVFPASNSPATTYADGEGEITFFNQGGYVARYKITINGVSQVTGDMAVGQSKSYRIPAGSTSIQVSGEFNNLGVWKPIFNESYGVPTFQCYRTYGTIGNAQFDHGWPYAGDVIGKSNQVRVFNQGGYYAKFQIDYTLNGLPYKLESGTTTVGWAKTYDLPADALNVRVRGWCDTLIQWNLVFDTTTPAVQSACYKLYGTFNNPQSNNNCSF